MEGWTGVTPKGMVWGCTSDLTPKQHTQQTTSDSGCEGVSDRPGTAKSEHSLELEQLGSLVAPAIHHIGAMLAPVKLHLLVGGGHQKLLAAVAKMVKVLSAPEHRWK